MTISPEPKPTPVGDPPDASGIAAIVPMTGISGLIARAYVRRHLIGGPVLAAGVLAVLVFNFNGGFQVVPAREEIAVRSHSDDVGLVDIEALPVLPEKATPSVEQSGAVADAGVPGPATTSAEPPVDATNVPDLATGTLGTELGALDMNDLAAAVDNLGIRVAEAERKLSETVAAPETAPVTPEVEPAPSQTEKPRELSEEDAALEIRLSERVTRARESGDVRELEDAERELSMFRATLDTVIEFRIVDRTDAKAGFWRSRADDPKARQYFLVVEAVVDGEPVNWAIRDADSGRVVSAAKFGLKVDEQTFAEFADDKKEDGRIDDPLVGLKPLGRIAPVWSVKTGGETISGVGE